MDYSKQNDQPPIKQTMQFPVKTTSYKPQIPVQQNQEQFNQFKALSSNLQRISQQSYTHQLQNGNNKQKQQPPTYVASRQINENQRKDNSTNRRNNAMDQEKNNIKDEVLDRFIQDKNQFKPYTYQDYQQKQISSQQQQQQQQKIKQMNDRDVQNFEQPEQSNQLQEYESQIKRQQDQIKALERQVYKLQKENSTLKHELQKKEKVNYEEMKSMLIAMKMQEREQREIEARQYYEFMKEAMAPQHDTNDPDHMTYEQLLELQEKIGYVNRGYSQEEIGTIKEVSISLSNKSELPDQCSICFNNYQIGEKYRQLRCRHQYHSQCIEQWLSSEKKCPICKEEALE